MCDGKVLDTFLHIYKLVVVQSNVSLKEAEELSPGTVPDLKERIRNGGTMDGVQKWEEQNILRS